MNDNRTEWVIHIWGKKRDILELNDIEKFHIDMLKQYKEQIKSFDKILVNIALDDINDSELFNFLQGKLEQVLINDNVEYKYCQNESSLGEYVTFRPYVFDRIGEDVDIFYSHFKGYGSNIHIYTESFPNRIVGLCELFWIYIMYKYSFNLSDVRKKLKNNSVYCWFVVKNNKDDHIIGFYKDYQNTLQEIDERYKDYVEDDLCKHVPGSFVWYNMKNLGESLNDKPLITSIDTNDLIKYSDEEKGINLCTHFCEVYLMQFLKESECYSANDFNEAIHKMKCTLYTQLYPAKTVAREHIKDFEKYLIEHRLI